MKVKFEMDTKEFTQTMREYAAFSKKDAEETVVDRAGKLSYELYKQFVKITPTIRELRALPGKLKFHIKRNGRTVAQEIRRRIAARKTAAIGWLPAVVHFYKTKAPVLKKRIGRGRVRINFGEPSVTLENDMKEAFKAEEKYHAMQKAVDAQTEDMRVYIRNKLLKRAKQFSAK